MGVDLEKVNSTVLDYLKREDGLDESSLLSNFADNTEFIYSTRQKLLKENRTFEELL